MLVEKLNSLKELISKKEGLNEDRIEIILIEDKANEDEDHEMDKDALDDCIAEKVPIIFDEMPDLNPDNEDDRRQAVAIAADKCRESLKD